MQALPDRPTPTDEEILATYQSDLKSGIRGASVKLRLPLTYVSRALKRMNVVSDPRAGSGQDGEDVGRDLAQVSDAEWYFIAGVFAAQKKGVYLTKAGSVRIYMTISDLGRMEMLRDMLRVGELNAFPTNGGKNIQYVYRMAREQQVRTFLTEVRRRLPRPHAALEEALAALNGTREDSKDESR